MSFDIRRPPHPATPSREPPPRRLRSTELFAGRREVRIEHQGVEYRLRLTRFEKLILTK
ncbi:MAG: hemin uptake protein HemP [Sinobacteraceae bacterium]|nr:hemin uptake protein HemP [Nevskiaceae bacterium]MCP5339262.1 hemin uptake protein HemP [Nevskiaceae bacterium]MCP5359389.1 hemin uptake protein HemP [Nevskiaceae bacterium]MCP5470828.1 hemin uptake protein HemP [Nevskiaceae bacterium]